MKVNEKMEKKHGFEILCSEGEVLYEGEWFKDKKNGKGTYWFSDKSYYEGEWCDDLKHGFGRFFIIMAMSMKENGKIILDMVLALLGEMKMTHMKEVGCMIKKKRFGVRFSENGDYYKGGWMNNVRHGHGEYIWKNGSIYNGDFKNNHKEGRGQI